jgi:hypothetical protein
MTLLSTQNHDSYARVILLEDADAGSDFVSVSYDIGTFDMGSLQFCFTGADTKKGKFIVEVSNNGYGWCSPYPDSLTKTTQTTDGCVMYDMPALPYNYIRARYKANANSTGTFTATLFVKRRRANHP